MRFFCCLRLGKKLPFTSVPADGSARRAARACRWHEQLLATMGTPAAAAAGPAGGAGPPGGGRAADQPVRRRGRRARAGDGVDLARRAVRAWHWHEELPATMGTPAAAAGPAGGAGQPGRRRTAGIGTPCRRRGRRASAGLVMAVEGGRAKKKVWQGALHSHQQRIKRS